MVLRIEIVIEPYIHTHLARTHISICSPSWIYTRYRCSKGEMHIWRYSSHVQSISIFDVLRSVDFPGKSCCNFSYGVQRNIDYLSISPRLTITFPVALPVFSRLNASTAFSIAKTWSVTGLISPSAIHFPIYARFSLLMSA